MTDRRLLPANGRVAAAHLRGQVTAERFVDGTPARVSAPLADLWRVPRQARDRQLLMGDAVRVYERRNGFAFVQAAKDGYVGYVAETDLADDAQAPTHWVAVPASHAYPAPDMKAPETHWLPFGGCVAVVAHQRGFYEIAGGRYVPRPHLRPLDQRFSDPVTAAQMFFGAPYLWGGNSHRGVDCSGLVQLALHAAGLDCPADSDQQQALGAPIPEGQSLRRGDLLFWKGHVALAVDGETLIHASAHRMAVTYEETAAAIRRIEVQGDGPVIARRRLPERQPGAASD